MPKPKPDEIDEELKKQDDAVYGTSYTEGDPDKFADTKEMVEEVIGNEPDEERDGFLIAEEVEDDEEAIADGAGTPGYRPDEPESELDKIERKEKYKEDASDE